MSLGFIAFVTILHVFGKVRNQGGTSQPGAIAAPCLLLGAAAKARLLAPAHGSLHCISVLHGDVLPLRAAGAPAHGHGGGGGKDRGADQIA